MLVGVKGDKERSLAETPNSDRMKLQKHTKTCRRSWHDTTGNLDSISRKPAQTTMCKQQSSKAARVELKVQEPGLCSSPTWPRFEPVTIVYSYANATT